MKNKIGIVGGGFVGGAIAKGFALYADVKVYDKDPKRSAHSLDEVCESDYIFLCLPTPMEHIDGGKADLDILRSVCADLQKRKCRAICMIKSTVPIGATESLEEDFGLNIIHNPEFLTARNADLDYITPSRIILGGREQLTSKVASLFTERFPGVNLLQMTSRESEAVKYVANCFFAVKVMYFVEAYLGLEKMGNIDWDTVMEGVLTDGRIGVSHHQVPGHDGKLGFSGLCVLPDAQVKLEKSPGEHYTCSIKEMFDEFKNTWKIEGSNAALDSVIFKGIKAVTETPVDENLYEFHTDNGVFTCTSEHLMPIERNGEKIIVPAKEIKDSDRLFSK